MIPLRWSGWTGRIKQLVRLQQSVAAAGMPGRHRQVMSGMVGNVSENPLPVMEASVEVMLVMMVRVAEFDQCCSDGGEWRQW